MKRKKRTPEQIKRAKQRFTALTQPITAEDTEYHSQFLLPINFGRGFCWFYMKKSSGGASKSYGRFKFHGVWVLAHRFALAAKLGCTLWDLEGFDAAHAPAEICMGGRCCNPEHLRPKPSDPNRSWDKAKDIEKFGQKSYRTTAQQRKMIQVAYPLRGASAHVVPDSIPVPRIQLSAPNSGLPVLKDLARKFQDVGEKRMNSSSRGR